MPGQPRDGQSGPGSASAIVLRQARALRIDSVGRRDGMTGALDGAAFPPDGGPSIGCGQAMLASGVRSGRRLDLAGAVARKQIFTALVKY
jgi:hypothetical protein